MGNMIGTYIVTHYEDYYGSDFYDMKCH